MARRRPRPTDGTSRGSRLLRIGAGILVLVLFIGAWVAMGKIPVSGRPMTVIAIAWLIWMAAALFAGGDRADQGPADDGS